MNKKAWDLVPTLKKAANGELPVFRYLGLDTKLEPTDSQQKIIAEMEAQFQKQGLKVLGIFEGNYMLGGCDMVHMEAYVYIDKKSEPWIINKDTVGFFANIINDTWDIQEYGSVGIQEDIINGILKRTM